MAQQLEKRGAGDRLMAWCQKLWQKEALLDCTIACPDGSFRAHKLVLCAASEFLSSVLEENPSEHPTVILDTSLNAMVHLLNYLYFDEVPTVDSEEFQLLATKLKLQGLVWSETGAQAGQQVEPGRRRPRGRPRKVQPVQTVEPGAAVLPAADEGQTGTSAGAPSTLQQSAAPTDTAADRVGGSMMDMMLLPAGEVLALPAASGSGGVSGSVVSGGPYPALLPAPSDLSAATSTANIEVIRMVPPGDGRGTQMDWHKAGLDQEDDEALDDIADEEDPDYDVGADAGALGRDEARKAARRSTSSTVQCRVCGRMCCNRQTLKVHMRIHTDERPFTCPVSDCQKSFRQKSHMKTHVRCHDSEKSHRCSFCDRPFRFESNRQRHEQLHKLGRPIRRRQTRADRIPLCDFCGKEFTSIAAYDNHVRVHTNQRPFVCSVCGKAFKQKSHLTEHDRIHSGLKPFQCERCLLTFYNRTRFRQHQVKHINEDMLRGERPMPVDTKKAFPFCRICQKRFINPSNLRLHMRRHSNEKPFQCHLCSCRFKLAKSLEKHLAAHAARQEQEQVQGSGEEQEQPTEVGEGGDNKSVILLREEEDGSLTYVPDLDSTQGRVVKVVLEDAERKNMAQLLPGGESWISDPDRVPDPDPDPPSPLDQTSVNVPSSEPADQEHG